MTSSNDKRRQPGPADLAALVLEIERLRAELARSEAQLAAAERLAHFDSLVDLPNRRSFIAALQDVFPQVEKHGVEASVLFADIDGLKLINDKFGHRAGDRALVKVAKVIAASVRKHDLVARLGGDEFAVLLRETDELSAWRMALRVAEAVDGSTLSLGDRVLPLSVAVGAATIDKGDTPEAVLSRADRVMYRFKAMGGSRLAGLITSVDGRSRS
jgi:diguanylate cyclase (GGDEF)-like protein